MSFIDPIRYPVAASEAATRAIRDQAAAAYHGGQLVPPSAWGTAVTPTMTPEQLAQLAVEERAAAVRLEADWARWEADRARSQAHIAAITDPNERLVMACRHWLINPGGYDPLANFAHRHMGAPAPKAAPKVEVADVGLFATAFPQYWPDESSVNLDAPEPPWNSEVLARWFAANAKTASIPTHKIDWALPGRFLNSRSRRSARGWQVTTTRWLSGSSESAGQAERVALLADGRLGDPTAHISAVGIVELADLLNLGNPQLAVGPRP